MGLSRDPGWGCPGAPEFGVSLPETELPLRWPGGAKEGSRPTQAGEEDEGL